MSKKIVRASEQYLILIDQRKVHLLITNCKQNSVSIVRQYPEADDNARPRQRRRKTSCKVPFRNPLLVSYPSHCINFINTGAAVKLISQYLQAKGVSFTLTEVFLTPLGHLTRINVTQPDQNVIVVLCFLVLTTSSGPRK